MCFIHINLKILKETSPSHFPVNNFLTSPYILIFHKRQTFKLGQWILKFVFLWLDGFLMASITISQKIFSRWRIDKGWKRKQWTKFQKFTFLMRMNENWNLTQKSCFSRDKNLRQLTSIYYTNHDRITWKLIRQK